MASYMQLELKRHALEKEITTITTSLADEKAAMNLGTDTDIKSSSRYRYWEGQKDAASSKIQKEAAMISYYENELTSTIQRAEKMIADAKQRLQEARDRGEKKIEEYDTMVGKAADALEAMECEEVEPDTKAYKLNKVRLTRKKDELARIKQQLSGAAGGQKALPSKGSSSTTSSVPEPVALIPLKQDDEDQPWGSDAAVEAKIRAEMLAYKAGKPLPNASDVFHVTPSDPLPDAPNNVTENTYASFPEARLLTDTKIRRQMLKGKERHGQN